MSFINSLFGQPQKAFLAIEDTQEAIIFDASLSETHTNSAEVTGHPIENGVDIADHVRRLPEELSINVIVSNHPPIFLASLRAQPISGFSDPSTRAQDAHEFLRGIMNESQLVRVSTTLREYRNMALTSLTCERDKDTGNVANMSLSLREVIVATTEFMGLPAPEPVSAAKAPKANLGKKPLSPSSASVAKKGASLLKGLFSAFGGP